MNHFGVRKKQILLLFMIGLLALSLSIALAACNLLLMDKGADDESTVIGDPLSDNPIRPLLGVNAGPTPVGAAGNADLTSAYQDIGVTLVRTHDFYGPLDMATMYPDRTKDPNDPASFHFTASDAAFAAIVAGGFEPYLRLGDSWNDATPPANARERANWVQAAVNVVRHYREGLWGGFEANVRYVEIWNEPDNPQFWPRPHTNQEFFQLYAETAQALKVASPDLKVGGAGFSPAGARAPAGQQFVSDFLDYVRDHSAPLDFLSWHLYANDPADFANAASFYRNVLDEKGFSDVPMHVTEWNTSTRRVSPDEAVALRAGAKGAALMSAAWIALQNAGVEAAAFYRGGDQGPDMTSGYGLFYADGRPKKIALAFTLWAELAAHPQRLTLTASSDHVLWSLAGQDETGEIAVLVVNPGDTATTYTFTDILGQPLSHYEVSVSEVSDDASSTRVFTPSTGSIPIGAYTVQLVRLSPVDESSQTPPTAGSAVIIPVGESDPADPTVKPLLGVIAGPDPNAGFTEPNLTPQYQDIGVLSVRNNDYYDDRLDMEGIFNCGGPTYPSWEGCDPNDDANYNWGPSDAQFASYLAGGFEPFLRLGGEWENRNRPHDFKGPQNATQEHNWIIAAHKVVERYLHWDGAAQTFTYLDIWTEFPGSHFWDRSPIEFINFWVKAYASLKGAYPQLKVGGPGFGAGETMKTIQGNANLSRALLTKLYDQGLHLDWLGWHLFSNDPTKWAQAARAYRQLLDGAGPYADVPWAGTGFFTDTEMIVDAYGFSSRSTDGTPPPQGARRASLLTAAWIAMQYGDIERAYYYRGNDQGATSPEDGDKGPGLFYTDAAGTPKPSAHAFRLWSQVYGHYPHLLQVTLPSTDPQVPLWVLAAQNDQGGIALLVANFSAGAVTWSPRFADGTTLQDYGQVELYQADEANDGRTATSVTDSVVRTPPYTVQLLALLSAAGTDGGPSPSTADLTFVPDPGFRVENATEPAVSVDPETGTIYLFYRDRSSDRPTIKVATSPDGLHFSAGRQPTEQDNPHHPFHVRLPDGTWRRYVFDPTKGLKSESSVDGIHYTPDPGVRYTLHPSDNGTMGVRVVYVDPVGGVVLLYVGDMGGVNNVRRAYSPPGDNGWTFTFEDNNVLGDANAGGDGYSYVDPKSILLPDGRRRLFTMRQGPAPPRPGVRAAGTIYSFISEDGKNYTLEPGVRLKPEDFTEFDVWSLNDPMVVRLPDGRHRMYVAALVTDDSGDARWVIVSATTAD